MTEQAGTCPEAVPPRSNYGIIGDISTDVLLARRLQRQQAERRAHLAAQSRTSFARRPMAPVQPHGMPQQSPALTGSGSSRSSKSAGASAFSRVDKRPLERPASTTQEQLHQEPFGVSVDELSKLLGDTGEEEGPAKRLKLSDLAPGDHQQAAAHNSPAAPVRPRLLTQQPLEPTATVAAACQRVAEQRKQQEAAAEAAAKAAAQAAAAREAAEARAKAASEAAALAGNKARQAGRVQTTPAAEHQGVPRWQFKKPGGVEQPTQQARTSGGNKPAARQPTGPQQQVPKTVAQKLSAKMRRLLKEKAADRAAIQGSSGSQPGALNGLNGDAAAGRATRRRRPTAANADTSREAALRTRASARRTEAVEDGSSSDTDDQQAADAAKPTAASKQTAGANRRSSTRGAAAATTVLGAEAVRTVMPGHDPMQQLSTATLAAPSRRVQQLHSAAAAVKDATKVAGKQPQPVKPPAAGQPASRTGVRATVHHHPEAMVHSEQEQLCSPEVQQEPASQQPRARLPSPLAFKIAAATAAGKTACAADSHAQLASAGTDAVVDGEVMLLDSDDGMDELLISNTAEGQQHTGTGPEAAGLPTTNGAAGFARVAANNETTAVAAALSGQVQEIQLPCAAAVTTDPKAGQQRSSRCRQAPKLPDACAAQGYRTRAVAGSRRSAAASSAAAADTDLLGCSDLSGSSEDNEQDSGDGSSSSGWEDSDQEGVQIDSSSVQEHEHSEAQSDSDADCDTNAGPVAAKSVSKARGPARKAGKAATAARKGRTRRSASCQAAAAAEGAASSDEDVTDPAAPKAAGGVKRRGRKSGGSGAKDKQAAATAPKTRVKKVTHRQNFRRHKTNGGGYSCKFVSKSAAHGGRRPFRRIINGRLIRGRRKAPHVSGQGAEFLEGFAGGATGGGGTAGKGRCFKCGQAGHWETDCPLKAQAIAQQEADMAEWRTAQIEKEQQGLQAQGTAPATAATAQDTPGGGTDQEPAAFGYPQHKAAAAAAQQAPAAPPPPLSHAELCSITGHDSSQPWQPDQLTDDQLRAVLKAVWGYEQFRGQQLPLIRAALQGRSMLGVLPTGLGKSLTYQLPAVLLQGLVVVVSPLLALMRDQVTRLPAGLPGAMLQGSMTRQEVEQILDRAEQGQLRLLYVAPEKLSAGPVLSCLRRLSPLPLVCVDEAHCMAEWGQGFRPAYFRLGHLLCNVLCPRAVLALTATATPATRACIRQLLAVPPENQIVESPLRSNLRLRVVHCNGASRGGGIAANVVQLLTTGELSSCRSVVVYAGTRAGADALAAQLQRAAVAARPYHAGMKQQHRELVQAAFTSGVLRVVVATVAFGMGVDKQDLEAVLHTSLPHSLEEYVQQVGRAGRDGRTGHCILFLDDADYVRLRALVHSGMVRKTSIESFLGKVFGREPDSDDEQADEPASTGAVKKKSCKKKHKLAPSQHRCLPLQSTCADLDTSEEVLECCLSFLQADPVEPYLVALPNAAAIIDVRFHKRTAEDLAEHHPVVKSILAAKTRKYSGTYKVHLDALLSVADRPPGELLSELVGLATAHEIGFDLGREGSLVWRLERQPEDWQDLVDNMTTRLDQIVRASVSRLDRCYFAMAGATIYTNQAAQERHLRAMIDDYFMDPLGQQQQQSAGPEAAAAANATAIEELTGGDMIQEAMQSGEMPWGGSCPVLRPSRESLLRQLRAAMHCISRRAADLGRGKFTGLTLARMLAGLSSPAVPASVWKGCKEYGTMAAVDTRLLAEVAEEVVAEFWATEK